MPSPASRARATRAPAAVPHWQEERPRRCSVDGPLAHAGSSRRRGVVGRVGGKLASLRWSVRGGVAERLPDRVPSPDARIAHQEPQMDRTPGDTHMDLTHAGAQSEAVDLTRGDGQSQRVDLTRGDTGAPPVDLTPTEAGQL